MPVPSGRFPRDAGCRALAPGDPRNSLGTTLTLVLPLGESVPWCLVSPAETRTTITGAFQDGLLCDLQRRGHHRVLASGADGAAHARRVMVSALGSPFLALDLHVQRVSCCAGHGQ